MNHNVNKIKDIIRFVEMLVLLVYVLIGLMLDGWMKRGLHTQDIIAGVWGRRESPTAIDERLNDVAFSREFFWATVCGLRRPVAVWE